MIILFMTGIILQAQVGVGTENPVLAAILEVKSTEKGFLPPRMTTEQRDAINEGNPAGGLVIYNTDAHCLQYWNTVKWVSFCEENSTSGKFTYWVDDEDIENDAKYLYIENGTNEDFSGNLFVYHDIWFFPYSTVPYIIDGETGSSWGTSRSLYKLGVYSIPAGETIRLKVELRPQSAQTEWLPTSSATVHRKDNLKLSRSVVVANDEAPVETVLPVNLSCYGPN